jgi:hypothetical protein
MLKPGAFLEKNLALKRAIKALYLNSKMIGSAVYDCAYKILHPLENL